MLTSLGTPKLETSSPSLEQSEQPLAEQAHDRRQQHTGHEAREREGPAEQRRLVRQRANGTHERLRGQQRDERRRRGPMSEEIGRNREEHVWPPGDDQTGGPADEDPVAQALGTEPARQHGLGEENFEQPREDEAERQLDPHAAHEPRAGGEAAQRQGGIAREGDDDRGPDQRQQDPEARVHATAPRHVRSAARAVRYVISAVGSSAPPRAASTRAWAGASEHAGSVAAASPVRW